MSTNFTNAVSGLVTLRTFERLPYFKRIFVNDLDKSCNATFTMQACSRHMLIQLDIICIGITICASSYVLLTKNPEQDNKAQAFTL